MYILIFENIQDSINFQRDLFKNGFKWIKTGRRVSPFKKFSVNIDKKTLNMNDDGDEITINDFVSNFVPNMKFDLC